MKCPRPVGLVLVAMLSLAYSMPTESTTTSTRLTPTFGDTIKKLTNQLMDVNATTLDMVSDTRTPPKVKQQVKLKEKMENSHAGVAIPVDNDDVDETTKKTDFLKIERPTTNSGLSTWILLSGQASTTKSPTTRKSVIKPVTESAPKANMTVLTSDKPNRVIKPLFKKRTPSTPKPTSTTTPATTSTTTTKVTTEPTKLTKIKASLLNAMYKRNATTTVKPTTTTQKLILSTPLASNNVTVDNSTSATLPAEAKEGEVDLTNKMDGKKKKTTNKRRKNKPKRRKPTDKNNTTSVAKPNKTLNKHNAISTQLYNYLAREIMPTVGVGLVGLMVTAGLASYFLYPFGAARRTFDIDRKDKDGSYYYSDDYSNGIPEEEAIGKVIAGMPSNALFPNRYKSSASRETYPNVKQRLTDRKAQIRPQYYEDTLQTPVENIPVTPKQYSYQNNAFEPITYNSDQVPKYSPSADKRFVVGTIPKEVVEEATPVTVPEHGPRNLDIQKNIAEEPSYLFNGTPVNFTDIKRDEYGPRSLRIRRKRSGMSNEIEDEINSLYNNIELTTIDDQTTEKEKDVTTIPPSSHKPSTTVDPPTTAVDLPGKVSSFIGMMRDLVEFKARLGFQIIRNITDGISKYISRVQERFGAQYRNMTRSN